MKELQITYTGDWTTTVQVPDDFELTQESIAKYIEDHEDEFDFQDGGCTWFPSYAQMEETELPIE